MKSFLETFLKLGEREIQQDKQEIKAMISEAVPAMTIDKQCASGLRSISIGYQQILTGNSEIIIAGGTESMRFK